MKKKEWFSLEKIKGISKNQLLIGGLAGILLLIIALPAETDKNSQQKMPEKESAENTEQSTGNGVDYGRELERKLEQILGEMEGVGKVEVMINLKDDGERILDKDITRSSQEVSEEDGTVKRNTRESQYQEETVFSKETEDGQPFVAKETAPQVEGVLVVAEGGGNAKTAKNISDAVLALFPVEVHKIKVVKMN
ncbi:stage III sporulation protein AG [Petralouisia muris]|uniref:Stage III sporulation protein AG n=1 Tax=Petralouisia muris TaxID=3032872 RepID=A0AC61RUK9_9FIRM|nr:stage III sporulation protein AG [Petralouisia muris]TGY95427.1 stage III sporulation protein AG [Petralouisia muris]